MQLRTASPLRKQGPMTTGRCALTSCCYLAQDLRPVVMGPGSALAVARLSGTTLVKTVALTIPLRRIRGDRGGRGAVLDAELGVDLLQMLVDRARAQT